MSDLHLVEPGEDPFDPEDQRFQQRPRTGLSHEDSVREELRRLRARHEAQERFNAERAEQAKTEIRGNVKIVDGASFFLDVPDQCPAIWGRDDQVVWARGESLMIGGPQGVGKTTLAGQLLRACVGLEETVWGLPFQPFDGLVGYLAMDRPAQAQRALHRMFSEHERSMLADLIRVWKGPLMTDAALDPNTFLRVAEEMGTECLFIDSVKDSAIGLAKDEIGAGYNRARQTALAAGVEIAELHHTVKTGADGGAPTNINGLYGSTWLTAGAGSVILLWGQPGDEIVQLTHLKQPMLDVGPFKIQHNRETGLTSVFHDEETDLVAFARRCKSTGLTVRDAACVMFKTEKPSDAEVQKARRKLKRLTDESLLALVPGSEGRGNPDRWFAAAPNNWGVDGKDWSDRDAA